MDTLGERLQWAIDRADITQDELGSFAGISQPSINHILSGKGKTSGYTAQMAHYLGVDAYWLSTGKGVPDGGIIGLSSRQLSQVRLFKLEDLQKHENARELAMDVECEVEKASFDKIEDVDESDLFAITLKDDSMAPLLPTGALVAFTDTWKPEVDEYVVCRLHDGSIAIRQYALHDRGYKLVAFNQSYGFETVQDDINKSRILGVVVRYTVTTTKKRAGQRTR